MNFQRNIDATREREISLISLQNKSGKDCEKRKETLKKNVTNLDSSLLLLVEECGG